MIIGRGDVNLLLLAESRRVQSGQARGRDGRIASPTDGFGEGGLLPLVGGAV